MVEDAKPFVVAALLRVDRVRAALSANPSSGVELSNLANGLRLEDRPVQALSWARWAVRPQAWTQGRVDPRALEVLGHALLDLGDYFGADRSYRMADPSAQRGDIQLCRSRAMLGLGQWNQSWQLAEQRLPEARRQAWPLGQELVMTDEQGFGDTLQALRWLPPLLKRQSCVELRVRAPLLRVLRQGLAWLGPQLTVKALDQTDHSCQGSLLSCPAQLGASHWAPGEVLRLPKGPNLSGPPRIALVWEAGRYTQTAAQALEYRRKSLPDAIKQSLLASLQPRGVELVLLQPGFDLDAQADFLAQAQLLQSCDLLISVDTAAAHLAGAMGFPTWLLLPWACASRWQRAGDRTALYSSMRLLRQPRHQDWSGLMQLLLVQLDGWLASDAWCVNRANSCS